MKFLTLIYTTSSGEESGNKRFAIHHRVHIRLQCRQGSTSQALMAATTTLRCQAYLSGDFLIDGCLMCDIYSCLRFRDVSGACLARVFVTFANHICKFLEAISWSLECAESVGRDAWEIPLRQPESAYTSLFREKVMLLLSFTGSTGT